MRFEFQPLLKRWFFTTILAVPAATCLAVPPIDSKNEAPLTVENAVGIGIRNNPQIRAATAGVAAALATYQSLGAFPNLVFGVSHVQGTSTAPSLTGDSQDTILDVQGTIDTSGQRKYQAAGAHATFKATRFQFQETLLTLEQQIRDAYWSLSAAKAQSRIAGTSLKEAERVFDLISAQEKAGVAPKGDVLRSSIDVANAKQAVFAAKGAEETALISLNSLLSQPPNSVTELASNLDAEGSSSSAPDNRTLEELTKQALENRPVLQASTETARSAGYSVKQAEAARLPDLNILYQRSAQQQVDAVSLTLSFPLFDLGSIHHSIRAAQSLKKQAEAQLAESVDLVKKQVAQAYSDLHVATDAATSYQKDILNPSSILLDMAKTGYQQGATGILPVIDAENTIRSARIGYISALLAILKAQDELKAAIGKP